MKYFIFYLFLISFCSAIDKMPKSYLRKLYHIDISNQINKTIEDNIERIFNGVINAATNNLYSYTQTLQCHSALLVPAIDFTKIKPRFDSNTNTHYIPYRSFERSGLYIDYHFYNNYILDKLYNIFVDANITIEDTYCETYNVLFPNFRHNGVDRDGYTQSLQCDKLFDENKYGKTIQIKNCIVINVRY